MLVTNFQQKADTYKKLVLLVILPEYQIINDIFKKLSNIFDCILHEKFLIIVNPPYIGHTSCKPECPIYEGVQYIKA